MHQIRPGKPVVTKGFDVADRGFDLTLTIAQELNDAHLHGVVLQLRLVHDPLVEGQ